MEMAMHRFCFSMFACTLLGFVILGVAMGEDATGKTFVSESRASLAVEGKMTMENGDSDRLISPATERSLNRSRFDTLAPFMVTPKAEAKATPESSIGEVWLAFKEFVVSGINWLTSGHNLYWSVGAIFIIGYLRNKMRR